MEGGQGRRESESGVGEVEGDAVDEEGGGQRERGEGKGGKRKEAEEEGAGGGGREGSRPAVLVSMPTKSFARSSCQPHTTDVSTGHHHATAEVRGGGRPRPSRRKAGQGWSSLITASAKTPSQYRTSPSSSIRQVSTAHHNTREAAFASQVLHVLVDRARAIGYGTWHHVLGMQRLDRRLTAYTRSIPRHCIAHV
eukprot:3500835-Rhodomonas_salina.2